MGSFAGLVISLQMWNLSAGELGERPASLGPQGVGLHCALPEQSSQPFEDCGTRGQHFLYSELEMLYNPI